MTDWTAFAGFAGVVLTLLLLLAHVSKGHLSPNPGDVPGATFEGTAPAHPSADEADEIGDGSDANAAESGGGSTLDAPAGPRERRGTPNAHPAVVDVPPEVLLVNVALSQGLFAGLLVVGAWVSEVPATALGLGADAFRPAALAAAVGLGVALYAANEVGSAVGERVGLGGEEALREALAPETWRGWTLLLFVVLPVIAGFEELLFRGVLVGALAVGFGVSPWMLAALSSVAFALGHGAQGAGGVVVTGVLGFALAAAFVLTGSLVVVFVAHYLVNALAFVVHEGLGVDPLR